MDNLEILDTTIRDGSYAINFSFTVGDVALLCSELERAGIRYIEVGHGVGLGAGTAGYPPAIHSDEEYMAAAAGILKTAKFGMFCIPGVAKLEDIDLAKKYHMGFIRIGTNVTEVEQSEPFVKKAKDCGMMVTANFMKSYALPPEQFAEKALLSRRYGVDVVYIVDSAGGMFGKNIRQYIEAVKKVSDVKIGFHGHDNLSMAVSNSIEAAEGGAAFLDASLQGLGRSAGNASTEILIAALQKLGYDLDIDLFRILEIGPKYIQPLISEKGKQSLDIIAGYSEFHSSYMNSIQKYSARYSVNPLRLIMEYCKTDKVNMNEEVLERIARSIQKEDLYYGKYRFNLYLGGEQDERGTQ